VTVALAVEHDDNKVSSEEIGKWWVAFYRCITKASYGLVDNNLSTCLIQCNFVQKSTGPVTIKTKEPSSRIGKLQVINFPGILT